MPGIEKVCEFSGVSPGWEMYGFKRSHIQVHPEHRKAFSGAHAELVFTGIELQQCRRFGRSVHITTESHLEAAFYYDGDVQAWWDDKVEYYGYYNRIEYQYELRVTDTGLQGEVGGVYKNWSADKGAVLRRIKRLVGKNLVIRNECKTTLKQAESAWKKDLAEKAKVTIAKKG